MKSKLFSQSYCLSEEGKKKIREDYIAENEPNMHPNKRRILEKLLLHFEKEE